MFIVKRKTEVKLRELQVAVRYLKRDYMCQLDYLKNRKISSYSKSLISRANEIERKISTLDLSKCNESAVHQLKIDVVSIKNNLTKDLFSQLPYDIHRNMAMFMPKDVLRRYFRVSKAIKGIYH